MQVKRYPSPEDIASMADDILDTLANQGEASFAIDPTGKMYLCNGSDDMLLGTARGRPGPDSRSNILQYITDRLVANVIETAPY